MARNLIKPRTRPKSITAILFLRLVQKLSRPGVIKLFVSIVPASHLQSFFHPNSAPTPFSLSVELARRDANRDTNFRFEQGSPLFLCPVKKSFAFPSKPDFSVNSNRFSISSIRFNGLRKCALSSLLPCVSNSNFHFPLYFPSITGKGGIIGAIQQSHSSFGEYNSGGGGGGGVHSYAGAQEVRSAAINGNGVCIVEEASNYSASSLHSRDAQFFIQHFTLHFSSLAS